MKKTRVVQIDRDVLLGDAHAYDGVFGEAGAIIRRGGLVAFPTETVYGLGADATNPFAAKRIYQAKNRPSDNPLIVHFDRLEAMSDYSLFLPEDFYRLGRAFWPGPMTLIVKKNDRIPRATSGGLDTVAMRIPADVIARRLIKESGCPVAAPSANRSGRPSPTKSAHVIEDLYGRVDLILDGGDCEVGLESTIIDLSGAEAAILRPGAVEEGMVRKVLRDILLPPPKAAPETAWREIHGGIGEEAEEMLSAPRAPGMKYRHYAPKAPLTILDGSPEAVCGYIRSEAERAAGKEGGRTVMGLIGREENRECYRSLEDAGLLFRSLGGRNRQREAARNLFAVLRDFDETAVDRIYAESYFGDILGEALMNRLLKAAGGRIQYLEKQPGKAAPGNVSKSKERGGNDG